jgi:hypothetical protein
MDYLFLKDSQWRSLENNAEPAEPPASDETPKAGSFVPWFTAMRSLAAAL